LRGPQVSERPRSASPSEGYDSWSFYEIQNYVLDQLYKLASSSSETLITLNLPMKYVNLNVYRKHSISLCDTRFPRLTHLIVSTWNIWPDDLNGPLRSFLLSHPDLLITLTKEQGGVSSSAKFTGTCERLSFTSLCMTGCQLHK